MFQVFLWVFWVVYWLRIVFWLFSSVLCGVKEELFFYRIQCGFLGFRLEKKERKGDEAFWGEIKGKCNRGYSIQYIARMKNLKTTNSTQSMRIWYLPKRTIPLLWYHLMKIGSSSSEDYDANKTKKETTSAPLWNKTQTMKKFCKFFVNVGEKQIKGYD